MSYFQDVKEFHEKFGLDVATTPQEMVTRQLHTLRMKLHREEYLELQDAMIKHNLVEIADALADLIYVLCGTAVSYGIPLDEVFAEVQASNMSKLGEDGKPVVREDGKILKGPNFRRPELGSIIYAND